MYIYYLFSAHFHDDEGSCLVKDFTLAYSDRNNMESIWRMAADRASQDMETDRLTLESINLNGMISEENYLTGAEVKNLKEVLKTIISVCSDKDVAKRYADVMTRNKYVEEKYRWEIEKILEGED